MMTGGHFIELDPGGSHAIEDEVRLCNLIPTSLSISLLVMTQLIKIRLNVSVCPSESMESTLLGGSGGVVNSLDFCPASLKSLGFFYFRCVLSPQRKAVTANLRILHCQF